MRELSSQERILLRAKSRSKSVPAQMKFVASAMPTVRGSQRSPAKTVKKDVL